MPPVMGGEDNCGEARASQKMVEALDVSLAAARQKVDAVAGDLHRQKVRSGVAVRGTKRSTTQQSTRCRRQSPDSHEESKKGKKPCPPGYRWDSRSPVCPKHPPDDGEPTRVVLRRQS